MIDLHLHTTASDGTCTPEALVAKVRAAGIRVMSVTDHDTTAALAVVRGLAERAGIECLNGIEITSVVGEHDVHVLGYAFDAACPRLADFLCAQRADRVRRVRAIGARLVDLGVPVDVEAVITVAGHHGGRSVGRPMIADALMRAGHASSRQEAFARFLGRERPAYVPRTGPPPHEVVRIINEAHGLASLAHPGVTKQDACIPALAEAGLAALEVYHSDHASRHRARYARLARELGLAVTGGSDFHGEESGRARPLGVVSLPRRHYEALIEVARTRACAGLPRRGLSA